MQSEKNDQIPMSQISFPFFFKIEDASKVEIIDTDMTETDQDRSLRIILRSILETTFSSESQYDLETKAFMAAARNIKINLDNVFRKSTPWQVVVGREYGTFVTHENRFFLFLKMSEMWVTVFLSN